MKKHNGEVILKTSSYQHPWFRLGLLLCCLLAFSGAGSAARAQSLQITDLRVTPNGRTVSFTTQSNQSYRLEFSDSLDTWQTLLEGIPGDGQIKSIFDSAVARQRFYRVVMTGADDPFAFLTNSMVWIQPGTFIMGSPSTEADRESQEGPQTRVTLTRGYWMSKYLVTQAQYSEVMGNNPAHFAGDDLPVESVRWIDATNYCGKLTQRERAAGRLPLGYVYRLPTEAEWEYACRAGTTTRFSFGDDPDYTLLWEYAWYWNSSALTTHPVGTKLPNPWGLYDMQGNVCQWCSDWYGAYRGGIVTDPKGPSSGSYRVIRGGSWGGAAKWCRSAWRGYALPLNRLENRGFRPVLATSL